MAGKSPTELNDLIAVLNTELVVLTKDLDLLRDAFGRAELAEARERLTRVESLLALVDIRALLAHIATQQEQVAELKKWREETERKRWQFWFGVGICGLTFTANLVMNLVLFFARKPG